MFLFLFGDREQSIGFQKTAFKNRRGYRKMRNILSKFFAMASGAFLGLSVVSWIFLENVWVGFAFFLANFVSLVIAALTEEF